MDQINSSTIDDAAWPPAGWVSSGQAARILGISVATLTGGGSRWRLGGGKGVRKPGGGRCKIYPIEEVERLKVSQAQQDAAGPEIPQGFVGRDEARRLFGVTARQWKHWITRGEVSCGMIVQKRGRGCGGRCTIYPVEALKKLREQLFSRDVLYNYAKGNYLVPAGWSRRHEACQMLGVDRATWDAWKRDGLIPRGQRFDHGPTLYRIEELKTVLQRIGRLAPPYSQPDDGGALRVPLCGSDGENREAIIDAESLQMLDGAILSWGGAAGGEGTFVTLCTPAKPRGVALHRVILGISDNERCVGHVNGDPLDCRRSNLFAKTIAQRVQGARKQRRVKGPPCTSRFKGVFFESWTKKWRTNIEIDGKRRSLGRYGDEMAAAQAYDEAARDAWGEYAWLNFPDGVDAWLEKEATRKAQRDERAAA
jgi:hypothetical protein